MMKLQFLLLATLTVLSLEAKTVTNIEVKNAYVCERYNSEFKEAIDKAKRYDGRYVSETDRSKVQYYNALRLASKCDFNTVPTETIN